jgi:DNA-binding transcriptional LysR family regulator
MTMDQIRALRIFVRIVDTGSFAAAARAMDLAPAVVTRTMAELEHHLGTRLLNRSTRRLALTSIGESYLERARAIVQNVDDATALARESHAAPRGPLRVVAPPYFAAHQLVRRLPDFHESHPDVTVEVTTAWPVTQPDEQHDVTIIVAQPPLRGDFVARRLARAEVVLCAAPPYLARHGRPGAPRDLAAHRLMLPPALQLRGLTLRRGDEEAAVTALRPAVEASQLELNLAAALAGLGIAALASYAAADALREGRLERVLPGWTLDHLSIWACMPSRRHMPASTRAFIDFLIGAFGGRDADPWTAPAPTAAPHLHLIANPRRARSPRTAPRTTPRTNPRTTEPALAA